MTEDNNMHKAELTTVEKIILTIELLSVVPITYYFMQLMNTFGIWRYPM